MKTYRNSSSPTRGVKSSCVRPPPTTSVRPTTSSPTVGDVSTTRHLQPTIQPVRAPRHHLPRRTTERRSGGRHRRTHSTVGRLAPMVRVAVTPPARRQVLPPAAPPRSLRAQTRSHTRDPTDRPAALSRLVGTPACLSDGRTQRRDDLLALPLEPEFIQSPRRGVPLSEAGRRTRSSGSVARVGPVCRRRSACRGGSAASALFVLLADR